MAKNIADAPQNSNFSNSLWGIKRKTRCDKHSKPKQEKSLWMRRFIVEQLFQQE